MAQRMAVNFFLLVLMASGTAANGATILYNDFSDPSALTLNGDASVGSYKLVFTQDAGQASSVFYTQPVSFGGDGSFSTNFEFQTSVAYGIGYVFVLQNDSRGPQACTESAGGNLAYHSTNSGIPSISPSLGIAFISDSGLATDRIAILMNGSMTPVYYQDIQDNYFHTAWNA